MKILYRGIFIATFKRTYMQDQAWPTIVTSLLSYETSPYFSWREKSLLPKFLSQLEPWLHIKFDQDCPTGLRDFKFHRNYDRITEWHNHRMPDGQGKSTFQSGAIKMKTWISLCICESDQYSLSANKTFGSFALKLPIKRTAEMNRLIQVLAGHTGNFVGFAMPRFKWFPAWSGQKINVLFPETSQYFLGSVGRQQFFLSNKFI